MWWNKILQWFSTNNERNQLLYDFNNNAKLSFINNAVPVYLKAESSRGNSAYRHQFSNFWYHGFRIRSLTGRDMTNDEIIQLGAVIISNTNLSRRLISLGYDTLEITNNYGTVVGEWRLTALIELT